MATQRSQNINEFKFTVTEKRKESEIVGDNPKYMSCYFPVGENNQLILEKRENGEWYCIPKYSKGNSTNLTSVTLDPTRYRVKYFDTLNNARGLGSKKLVDVQVEYVVKLRFENGVANVGYGFNPHYYDCVAKEPGMKVERYRMHTSISPTNLVLTHLKTGRTFKTTNRFKNEAGMYFSCNMIDEANGKTVAEICWETYYKD